MHYKADIHTCRKCGKKLCGSHIYSYVDESNGAITKNSPLLCRECYEEKYGAQRQLRNPSANVIDITTRLKAKREQEETGKALSKFKADYLPNFTANEVEAIMTAPEEKRMDIVMTACMRVDLERSRG